MFPLIVFGVGVVVALIVIVLLDRAERKRQNRRSGFRVSTYSPIVRTSKHEPMPVNDDGSAALLAMTIASTTHSSHSDSSYDSSSSSSDCSSSSDSGSSCGGGD